MLSHSFFPESSPRHNLVSSLIPLTFHSCPPLFVQSMGAIPLSEVMQGCRVRRDPSARVKPSDSASFLGHASCHHPPGWLGDDLGGPLAEAGCCHHHLRVAGSSEVKHEWGVKWRFFFFFSPVCSIEQKSNNICLEYLCNTHLIDV